MSRCARPTLGCVVVYEMLCAIEARQTARDDKTGSNWGRVFVWMGCFPGECVLLYPALSSITTYCIVDPLFPANQACILMIHPKGENINSLGLDLSGLTVCRRGVWVERRSNDLIPGTYCGARLACSIFSTVSMTCLKGRDFRVA